MKIKLQLKEKFRDTILHDIYIFYLIEIKNFFIFRPVLFIRKITWFLIQFKVYKKLKINHNFVKFRLYPCLFDNINNTPIDPVYFLQDSWAARKIFELNPKQHYDIGSSIKTISILSQFVPVTMIDIRPVNIELPNLYFKKGSILNLPFKDASIESLSALCVIEHIGLGRYGDEICTFGSEKAIQEITRVLNKGGVFLFSVPVDSENIIYFNAHRAFTRNYIMALLNEFELIEEKYIYGLQLYDKYEARKGFGTGLYMLRKL